MHFLGQANWQAPQSTQADSLIIFFLSFSSVIHPIMHTRAQVPQPTQSNLLILLGIISSVHLKNYNVCLQEVTVTSNVLVRNGHFSFIILKLSPSFRNLAVPSIKNPVPGYW